MTPLKAALKSVRWRLLTLALLPLVVLIPTLLGFTMWRWIDKFDELLLAKVASDLRIAEQYFGTIEALQATKLEALAKSAELQTATKSGAEVLPQLLDTERASQNLDFLVIGQDQTVPSVPVLNAIASQATPDLPSSGLAVLSAAEMESLDPRLAANAILPLRHTEAARPIDRAEETRGMFLLVASRIPEQDNVLIGGRLLNQNLDFIDTMNRLIYQDRADSGVRTGTTTLFLEDVRVSTNVRLFEGERALGTRVSQIVFDQVMGAGQPWLDRAFVVNDWYMSGYVPLQDVEGKRIGMLYTGFLEEPFATQRNRTIVGLILSFLFVLAVTVPLFLNLARGVFAPLERMTSTMVEVEGGALDARIGQVDAGDEIGAVAQHLDRLLDQVQERDARLRQSAENLNELVDQRTSELRDAKEQLEATFAQLVMSEKLASIGEITAGVAHEINNPVAVIQGNLEILRANLTPEARADLKTELDLIDAQSQRINLIVGKLLDFTRPGELSAATCIVDVTEVVRNTLVLVAPDFRKHGIETEVTEAPAPPVQVVETELQQVLINLFVNAAQAMASDGIVTVHTQPAVRDGIVGAQISVRDTGPGIEAKDLPHVFDPFFTTKRAEGSGLGLSISQTLIARAGGIITVDSVLGQGTTFFIWCPAADTSVS